MIKRILSLVSALSIGICLGQLPARADHGKEHSRSETRFLKEAAIGNMAEIRIGNLAAKMGQSAEVRNFGQKLAQDHAQANEALMKVAGQEGVQLPSDLDQKHLNSIDKLSQKSGADFDKAFVAMMLKDHKKDVGEFEKESRNGRDTQIREYASQTLPTLREHLQIVERLEQSVGHPSVSSK